MSLLSKSVPSSAAKNTALRQAERIVHALVHPTRIEILAYIDAHDSACVHQIYAALSLEQSVASQHLRLLRMAGLVDTRRDGKFIYYTLNYKKIAGAAQTSLALAKLFP